MRNKQRSNKSSLSVCFHKIGEDIDNHNDNHNEANPNKCDL